MKYVIISGSHREKSQSSKVSSWLKSALEQQDKSFEVEMIDLKGNPFPLWDERAWDSKSDLSAEMAPHLAKIKKSDGIIIVAPEWGGMVPGGLKNFLLYVTSQHAAHKPCLLVGVSASKGGAYPIAELRMSGYKNNRMVYIPDHLIVRNVESVMNSSTPEKDNAEDAYIQKRAHYSLEVLEAYTYALRTMREGHVLLNKEYPFGM